ncbi:MAG: hypothetical protein ACOYM3_11940 [Terrimicrobiaceae bacterium]
MKVTIVGTGMFLETNSGNIQETLQIRAGEIVLARISGSKVLVGNRVICGATIPEAIAMATGCTTQEATAAISVYSEKAK